MDKPAMETGQYLYYLNGELAEVEERWQIDGRPEDLQRINSSRTVPGLTISVDATILAGEVDCFEVRWLADQHPAIAAIYSRREGFVSYSRGEGEGVPTDANQLPVTARPLVLYPLMRIFTGGVIQRLSGLGGSASVLVPSIVTPTERDSLLLPDISQRSAVYEKQVQLERGSGETVSCECWSFTGGQYGPDARFWLDSNGRMQRYLWQQDESRQWDVRLT